MDKDCFLVQGLPAEQKKDQEEEESEVQPQNEKDKDCPIKNENDEENEEESKSKNDDLPVKRFLVALMNEKVSERILKLALPPKFFLFLFISSYSY